MTQKNEQDGKLTLRRPGRLELKKTVETGQVRQSFSHGRSKTVQVEVKRSRTFEPGASGRMKEIVRDAEGDGYRMSSFILGVVKSDPFQMMRAEASADGA